MATPLRKRGCKRRKVSPAVEETEKTREQEKNTIMAIIRRSSEAIDAEKMEKHIKVLATRVDDPPILFDWSKSSVRQFLTKAIAHGVAPPAAINKGASFAAPVTDQMIDVFKENLLDYLCAGR